MCSTWKDFDEADTAARQAHARRIDAVADLLDTYPEASLASMISARSQVSYRTAREWVREACDLRDRPEFAEAYDRGEVSTDQMKALRVLAEPGSDGAWIDCLAGDAGNHDFRINDLERMARRKVAETVERRDGGRYFKMAPTRDERFVRGRFQLHPEEAAALEQQLDARVPDATRFADLPSAHADALTKLVADASDGGGKVTTTVVVRSERRVLDGDSDTPGELSNDTFVPAAVVRDMALTGKVLEVERPTVDLDTKDIPQPVRRWVYHRDEGRCRAPDCPTPTLDLEQHHLVPRSCDGTHHPSNVLLVCVVCHQIKIHRDGWRVVGDAERDLKWIRPDGTVYEPPPILKRARAPDPN